MEEFSYGETHDMIMVGKTYQIQQVNWPLETFYLLFQNGEKVCTVRRNEQRAWQSTCGLSETELIVFDLFVKIFYEESEST